MVVFFLLFHKNNNATYFPPQSVWRHLQKWFSSRPSHSHRVGSPDKNVTSSRRLQTTALLHNGSITRRLHSTSRFKYDTLLFQQIKVENRGEIKHLNRDTILTVKV